MFVEEMGFLCIFEDLEGKEFVIFGLKLLFYWFFSLFYFNSYVYFVLFYFSKIRYLVFEIKLI